MLTVVALLFVTTLVRLFVTLNVVLGGTVVELVVEVVLVVDEDVVVGSGGITFA